MEMEKLPVLVNRDTACQLYFHLEFPMFYSPPKKIPRSSVPVGVPPSRLGHLFSRPNESIVSYLADDFSLGTRVSRINRDSCCLLTAQGRRCMIFLVELAYRDYQAPISINKYTRVKGFANIHPHSCPVQAHQTGH